MEAVDGFLGLIGQPVMRTALPRYKQDIDFALTRQGQESTAVSEIVIKLDVATAIPLSALTGQAGVNGTNARTIAAMVIPKGNVFAYQP